MELNALRAALRGISAYRDVTNTAVLSGIWMLLDALNQCSCTVKKQATENKR